MGQFSTTHWSVVLAAGQSRSEDAGAALQKICERYWYPLYSYVRRTGRDPHAAKDVTQGFFLHLIDSSLVSRADPDKGRFRSFMLRSLQHYLVSEHRSARAAKRGGGVGTLSLDESAAESRFAREPRDEASPEKLFERNWALNLLEQALKLLKQEYDQTGKGSLFAELESVLLKDPRAESYREIAANTGLTPAALRVSVFRLRQRFREIVRGLVASTVDDPLEVNAELKHLFRILSA